MLLVGTCYFGGLRAREFAPTLGINEVTLVLAGRGSGLCGWISNVGADLQVILRDSFVKGYKRDRLGSPLPRVNIVGAILGLPGLPRLKTEVALGALEKPIGVAPPHTAPIFGEINWQRAANKGSVEWNARLTNAEMAGLLPPNDANSVDCYIQELITILNPLYS